MCCIRAIMHLQGGGYLSADVEVSDATTFGLLLMLPAKIC